MPPGGEVAQPFETYEVSFEDRAESLEDVFGRRPLTFSEMTKKLWDFIRDNKLTIADHRDK